tara:strand:+ start:1754 stop:2716 length:963 start_codon:yes stop_codon:yes gene_type:complete
VHFIDENGIRVRKSLQTTKKLEAEERVDTIRKRLWLAQEGLLNVEKPKVTLGDLIEDYLNNVVDVNNKSQQSKDTDKRWINRFKDYVGEDTLFSDIAETQCNGFVQHHKDNNLAETTLHKAGQILCTMFKYASRPPFDAKYNPFEWAQGVKQLSKKGEKLLPIPWDNILMAIDKTKRIDDKMYWTMLTYTGMSPIDTPLVTRADFDKGYFQRSKTSVRFSIWLHPEIAKYGDAIFGLYPKKSQRDESNRRFKKLNGTGQPCKMIRKTFASTLLTQFESAEDAIAYTGHTNIKTLVDYYATVDPEVVKVKLQQMFPEQYNA